jgi:hypothetical protein
MMMFLYGVRNMTMLDEPLSQARVPAETEPEAMALLRKSFYGVLDYTEESDDILRFELLDVQEVTDPEVELGQMFIMTPDGQVWNSPLK